MFKKIKISCLFLCLINSDYLKSDPENLNAINIGSFSLDFIVNSVIYKVLINQKIDFMFNKIIKDSKELEKITEEALLTKDFPANFNINLNNLSYYVENNYKIELKNLFNSKAILCIFLSLLKDKILNSIEKKYFDNSSLEGFVWEKVVINFDPKYFNLSSENIFIFLISDVLGLCINKFYLLGKLFLNKNNLYKSLDQKFNLKIQNFILSDYTRFLALVVSNAIAIKKFDSLANKAFIENISKNTRFLKLLKNYNKLDQSQETEIKRLEKKIKKLVSKCFSNYNPKLFNKALFGSKLLSESIFAFMVFGKAILKLRDSSEKAISELKNQFQKLEN